jgi:Peroxisomal membrane protein (Pex16)
MEQRLKPLFAKYANFITNNSETTSDVEMLCKYLSYFVSGELNKLKFYRSLDNDKENFLGKITDNGVVTEGLFSLSNLMVLFNDQIIRKQLTKDLPSDATNQAEESVKLFLTILETVEVLIEITSKKILGNKRRFIIIFIIQAIKCIGRLILVVKYKNRISQCPAIEHLDRKNLSNFRRPNAAVIENPQEVNDTSITLQLKRSGKVIRKVAQSPPLYSRSFKAPELAPNDRFGVFNHKAIKNAELVYILKPIVS